MIGRLKGRLDEIAGDHCLVDVGGVGYIIYGSARMLANLPGVGETVDLRIETQVREDAITLFGFAGADEKALFRLLMSVQGVGARVALAILSVLAPHELETAIAAEDVTAVSRANGVGPKLAKRIVSELKDKVAAVAASGAVPGGADAPVAEDGAVRDAVSALVNLGYGKSDAHGAVIRAARTLEGEADLQTLIRQGLKELTQ